MFKFNRVNFRVVLLVMVMVMVMVMGTSCSDEADESVGVDVREVEGSSPPASSEGESQFAGELKKQEYDAAEAPGGPVLLRWDFSREDVFEYTYKQEVRNKADMGGVMGGEELSEKEQEMSGEGSLALRSKGDGTAELVLKDVKMIIKGDLGSGDTPDVKEQTVPPVVIQGIKEDGSGPFGNKSQDMSLRLLFPLPEKELSVGESADVPMQMPFMAGMSVLQVKGRARITLARYVKVGDRTCAELEVDIDISELDVPPEMEGEYACSAKGDSLLYFDTDKRCFVSGAMALVIQFSIDAPTPKFNMGRENAPEKDERMKMSMRADSLIQVSLKE